MLARYRRSLVFTAVLAGLVAIMGAGPAAAQTDYTLSGRVLDASSGESLPGANVQIVGTNFGAATTAEGRFTLEARLDPGQYRIRVTFVGYEAQTRAVELADQQEVTLDPFELEVSAGRFEELVVTGQAGPTRRKELGNAISSVEAADLEDAPSSALRSLQGKISGARIQQNSGNPGGGMSIRLRGTGTILGAADPLIVVDGVIVSNDSPELVRLGGNSRNRLVDINPNDIERIEVVKGAAAAALYGSRANNGVVQIFTKEGQDGETEVTYSTRVATHALREEIPVNMAKNDQGQFLDNSGSVIQDGKRWDWQDFIFDRGYGTEQYLSVSGASGDTRFFTSGGFFSEQGILDETSFRRYNGTARLQHTVSDLVNLSVGARYSYNESKDIPSAGLNTPIGALAGFAFGPNTFDPRRDENGQFPAQSVLGNPLEIQSKFDFGENTSRFIGDIQVDLTPLENLTINSILGLDTFEQVATEFIPRGTSAPGLATGQARRSEFSNTQLNTDLNARYEASISPIIESTTLIGGTFQYESEETFAGSSQDLPPVTEVAGSGSTSRNFGETRTPRTIYGFFGQQSVDVGDRFFVTGALRLDASSSFGEEERWQTYPKVSTSLVLSEFDFWEEAVGSVFSSMKLRGAVGWSGGLTSIGSFDRFTSYNTQSFVGQPGLQPSTQLGASDIKPERQREIELGTDFSLFDERLSVEFTYYDQTTEDLLVQRSVAPTTGFDSRLANVGSVENTGVELRVQGVPVNREQFRWTSTVTYTRNRSEVSDIPSAEGETGQFIFPASFGSGFNTAARNGEPVGVFFGSAFKRNDNGEVVDTEGNVLTEREPGIWKPKNCDISASGCTGIPASADNEQVVGNPNPDFVGSWINRFQIGDNFSARFQIDAEVGGDVANFTRRIGTLSFFGTSDIYERELEGELPSGYSNSVFNIYENWVEDGTYVKLRGVSLNYTFQIGGALESVKINASGRNLFSIDDYTGWDPETNAGGQRTGIRGWDVFQVPTPRSFSLGATLSF